MAVNSSSFSLKLSCFIRLENASANVMACVAMRSMTSKSSADLKSARSCILRAKTVVKADGLSDSNALVIVDCFSCSKIGLRVVCARKVAATPCASHAAFNRACKADTSNVFKSGCAGPRFPRSSTVNKEIKIPRVD